MSRLNPHPCGPASENTSDLIFRQILSYAAADRGKADRRMASTVIERPHFPWLSFPNNFSTSSKHAAMV
jgi:hypothetical protein